MPKITITISDGDDGQVDFECDLDEVLIELADEAPTEKAPLSTICVIGIRELFSCGYVIDAGIAALTAAQNGEDTTEAVMELFTLKE